MHGFFRPAEQLGIEPWPIDGDFHGTETNLDVGVLC
jgi:hypothetical protein